MHQSNSSPSLITSITAFTVEIRIALSTLFHYSMVNSTCFPEQTVITLCLVLYHIQSKRVQQNGINPDILVPSNIFTEDSVFWMNDTCEEALCIIIYI